MGRKENLKEIQTGRLSAQCALLLVEGSARASLIKARAAVNSYPWRRTWNNRGTRNAAHVGGHNSSESAIGTPPSHPLSSAGGTTLNTLCSSRWYYVVPSNR